MNDMINSGALNIASLAVSLVILVVGLIAWFFVNRASVKANEQIALLEALLDQQKRQTVLLRRICEANEPEPETAEAPVEKTQDDDGLIRLVAER
ncbi:YebO family protein [Atlantibacter hermannii]|uniref:YebO family protein n=1 Tax=Atlantibacter hermannii TaxID=565 RepID=UPI002DBE97FC|nr:YebO family protein [Atlantibacter hermannii]MEB7923559.1 YebO family protein [Atlantibacter hermannii]